MDITLKFSRHSQWPYVAQVLDTLTSKGYQAFLVGGAVRDALLGIEVKDFDVATSARPNEVEKIFPKTVPIGKEFGVIAVVCKANITVEVTTFRKESEYDQKRRPKGVEFTDLKGDGSRRDFTINALYYDIHRKELVDPFGGIEDLNSKKIRAIGVARERLEEDPLRILRALRFESRFQFSLDEELKDAIKDLKSKLSQISKERVFDELQKMFKGANWKVALRELKEFSLFEPLHISISSERTIKEILKLDLAATASVVFSWIFLELPQDVIKKNLKSLKCSLEFQREVLFFIENGERLLKRPPRKGEVFLILKSAPKGFEVYLEGLSLVWNMNSELDFVRSLGSEMNARFGPNDPLPKPLVRGEDLIALGIKKGPMLGALKDELYLRQLEGSFTAQDDLQEVINELRRTSSEV